MLSGEYRTLSDTGSARAIDHNMSETRPTANKSTLEDRNLCIDDQREAAQQLPVPLIERIERD